MKKIVFTLMCWLVITSNAMQEQEQQFSVNILLEETYYAGRDLCGTVNVEKIISLLKKFDINTYSEEHGISLLHRVVGNYLMAHLNDDKQKIDDFKTIYETILTLFKDKINVNIKNISGNTPLIFIVKTIITKISDKNEETIKKFLKEFVMTFQKTIDFDTSNKEGKTIFDLCIVNPTPPVNIKRGQVEYWKEDYMSRQKKTEKILREVYTTYKESIKK